MHSRPSPITESARASLTAAASASVRTFGAASAPMSVRRAALRPAPARQRRPLLRVPLEEPVRLARSPRPRGVLVNRQPAVEHRREEPPRSLDLVGSHEERLVAVDDVEQERLICLGQLRVPFVVIEVEGQSLESHGTTRRFDVEVEREPLLRLHYEAERIAVDVRRADRLEEPHWRPPELDDDLGAAVREALAGAQVEGHTLPAPAVDVETDGRICLRAGIHRDAWLLAVRGNVLALDGTPDVLRQHDVAGIDGTHLFQ